MRLLARWTTLTLVLTNCATAAGTKTNANYCVIRPAGREMNVDSRKAGVQGNPTPTRHFTGGGIKSEHTYMSCHTCLFCQISENKNFRKFCAEFWRFFKNLRCFSFPLSSFAKFRKKRHKIYVKNYEFDRKPSVRFFLLIFLFVFSDVSIAPRERNAKFSKCSRKNRRISAEILMLGRCKSMYILQIS